jgi:centromeric protein E
VSYIEIYNEVLRDLLSPKSKMLKIHEDLEVSPASVYMGRFDLIVTLTQRGVFVGDLKEEIVTSADQVLNLMEMGESHRQYGATNMNEHSSRSHTIFRIVIESRDRDEAANANNNNGLYRVDFVNFSF